MGKKFLLVIPFILIIIGAYVYFSPRAEPVNSYTVKKTSLQNQVVATGNVQLNKSTDVYSPSTGIISKLNIKNGDVVKEGDRLFSVHSTATVQEKAAAYAKYMNAISASKTASQTKTSLNSQLESARYDVLSAQSAVDTLERTRSVSNINPSTGHEYTESDIQVYYSKLRTAREAFKTMEQKFNESGFGISAAVSTVEQTKLDYEATRDITVKAPASGIVVNLYKEVGYGVVADPKQEVLTITDPMNLLVGIRVNESDVNKLQIGQKADVSLEGYPDKKYSGRIYAIDATGTNDSGIVTYNAYVKLEKITSEIKPGMTTYVTINLDLKKDVYVVPETAITFQNGNTCVIIVKSKNCQIVKTGAKANGIIEIRSGIHEGDQIILDAYDRAASN